MFLFNVLFWSLDNGEDRIPGSAELIPDWALVYSRFGLRREMVHKQLIFLTVFVAGGAGNREIEKNSRFDGKNRESYTPRHLPGRPSAPAFAGAARCRYSRPVRPGELKE
jgi:hypothetical protein